MLTIWLIGFITGMCIGVPLLASLVMNVIGLIEGIIYLSKSDEEFYQVSDKEAIQLLEELKQSLDHKN